VRCKLENSIKGNPKPEFSFYYFVEAETTEEHNPYYKILFEAVPGRRYVFFLMSEGDVLRSIGDVGEYSIEVFTGSHIGTNTPAESAVMAISNILLKRGTNVDESLLAKNLQGTWHALDDLKASRLYTMRLLRELVIMPGPVRIAACELLVKWFSSYGCLYEIKDDISESSENQMWASQRLTSAMLSDNRILETLADPARFDFQQMRDRDRDSIARRLDELRILLSSPNSNVRKSACAAIRRYYPHEVSQCNPVP